MSLKFDIEKHPEMWSEELVAAVEDYKNGKRNSKRKLRKFVNREISEHYYNELTERYAVFHRINKEKEERKKRKEIRRKAMAVIAVVFSLCSILYVAGEICQKGSKGFAVIYFLLGLGLFGFVASLGGKESQEYIERLERENEQLKAELEVYKKSRKTNTL